MKRILSALAMTASISAISGTSFAALDFDGLQSISKIAFKEFSTANEDHVQHFTGYKVWKSGDDAKVKIYVTHDGMAMEFNYLCHIHEEGPECHKQ